MSKKYVWVCHSVRKKMYLCVCGYCRYFHQQSYHQQSLFLLSLTRVKNHSLAILFCLAYGFTRSPRRLRQSEMLTAWRRIELGCLNPFFMTLTITQHAFVSPFTDRQTNTYTHTHTHTHTYIYIYIYIYIYWERENEMVIFLFGLVKCISVLYRVI